MVKSPDWYEQNTVERVQERSTRSTCRRAKSSSRARVSASRTTAPVGDGGRNRRLSIPRNPPGCSACALWPTATPSKHWPCREPCRRVGMGFIGSEVAASLRQKGVSVTAVLGGVGPLAGVLGDEVGSVMAGIHRDKGVELLLDDRVVAFTVTGTWKTS